MASPSDLTGRRARSAGRDLTMLLAMSSELSRTLDSRERGALIARHIALATRVNECAISYWDREGDRVLTYGYYPRERQNALAAEYSLAEYPETRRVLERQLTVIVDVDDPVADPHEVAYLRSIGALTSAMLPLIAGGATIGLAELTSTQHVAFDAARLALAQSMANEAAMALESARLYERLEHQALHDPLTGLANRSLFTDRVRQALARTRRDGALIAVLFLDLDYFKTVNDGLGHAVGDHLLTLVGQRLAGAVRPGDTVARLGGDEFAIILDPVAELAEAAAVAERLLQGLVAPFRIGNIECHARASVGVAAGSGREASAEELLANADVAMYRAKERGKGRCELFEPSMREAVLERAELAGRLAGALERDEFVIHYQPIFELSSGRIDAVEALVRWRHPARGLIGPSDFIPIAEETGVIRELGRWVLERSCVQVRSWQRRLGLGELRLHVNLSPRQFQHPTLVAEVVAALEQAELAAHDLTLEITESLLMQEEPAILATLMELKELGVRLAIDDFGTGYSSLNYLQRFPIDALKIDKAFIDALRGGEEASALVRSIIQIAESLQLETVAEGVEHPEQRPLLAALHCRLAQGFDLQRPRDAAEIEALLSASRSSAA